MQILTILILNILLITPNYQTDSPHGSGFKVSCSTCHSSKGWQLDKEIYSFNHNNTNMPLQGQHIQVSCRQCHPSLVFSEAKTECISCHIDIHQTTVGPDCSRCHNNTSWLVKNINEIHQLSRFPLIGVHRTADCYECHKSESTTRFDVPGINCIDCHRQSFLAASNPNHVDAGFSEDCYTCHLTTSFQWAGAKFNHDRFPLVQGHSGPKCAECHKTDKYSDSSPDCYSCHDKDYLASKNPDHNASALSKTCTDCHTLSPGWKPANFDHTVFPLTLGHAAPKCSDCHIGGNYSTTRADCYSCHQQDYLAAKEPEHNLSGFSKTCTDCHTTNIGWKPTTFNHSQFPLTLGHAIPKCSDCHIGGNYTTTPIDCYSCHKQNFLLSKEPDHTAAGFAINCTDCHTTNPGWKPTSFNHGQFQLTLGHSVPTCSECHKGNYTSLPADCYSCHQQDFLATTDPNHSNSGFTHTCTDCHTTNPGWKPTTFNHTQFPLTLGHAVPTCADCHKGNYATLPADCFSCHQQDFLSTIDPNHNTAGFSHTCTICHTTNPGWRPATYSHTQFSLTLGHAGLTCADCHKGSYTATSKDCIACHMANYNSTINPNHQTLGFSTSCTTCHTTNPDWKPATFTQHDSQFPIYSGKHLGKWDACIDCHTNVSNYSLFSCIICHEHNKNDMDNEHIGEVSGYSWVSSECFRCHPRGTAD